MGWKSIGKFYEFYGRSKNENLKVIANEGLRYPKSWEDSKSGLKIQIGYNHGRSSLYSWRGSRPTNFTLCPINFLPWSVIFLGILMCVDSRIAVVYKTFKFEGKKVDILSKTWKAIVVLGILPHQLFPKSSIHAMPLR